MTQGENHLNKLGLSFLLKLLNISPQELSDYIHVHRTLVSKWKSGARTIDVNSKYLDQIIDFLIDKNRDQEMCTLENTMNSIYGYDCTKDDPLQTKLRRYMKQIILCETLPSNSFEQSKSQLDCTYVAAVPTYDGKNSVRNAIIHMLDIATTLLTPTNIICIYNDTFSKIMSDLEFRSYWTSKMIDLMNSGYKLSIIFSSDTDNASFFMYFYKLVFHENCTIRQSISHIESFCSLSIHFIENTIAVTSTALYEKNRSAYYTTIHTDPIALKMYSLLCSNIIQNSQKVFINTTIFPLKENERKYNPRYCEASLDPWQDTLYFYSDFISYHFMDKAFYEKILIQSGFGEKELEKEIRLFHDIKSEIKLALTKYKSIHFYPLDSINSFVKKKAFYIPSFSSQSDKNILIKKEDYEYLLNNLVTHLKHSKKDELCLLPSSLFPELNSIIIWCKKNQCLHAYDGLHSNQMIRSYNLSQVNQMASILEQQYLFTPKEYKQRDCVIEKISALYL